jgi:Ca2+-binding EF-hand superfamily protein
MFFTHGNPEHFCEHVYRTFDEDNDGSISFKEFLLAIGVTTGSDSKEKLKWAFKMYDINKDGLVDVKEMEKIIKALYEMLGSAEGGGDSEESKAEQEKKVKFLFEKIDANKDGGVNMEEFIDICNNDEHLSKLLCIGTASN